MSLLTKYRPETLDEVFGNKSTKLALENMLQSADRPHAFLLTGPRGCGKTTLGRILAKSVGCNIDFDFQEVDAGDFRGIDTVRSIRKTSQLAPIGGSSRVWFMDEVHALTKDAQTALLKSLEQPPGDTYFILATTDPQQLIDTVRDRCKIFEVEPLSTADALKMLKSIVEKEQKEVPIEVLKKIAKVAEGRPRGLLNMLGTAMSLPEDQMLDAIKSDDEVQAQAIDLCRALLKRTTWSGISKIIKGLGDIDCEGVRRMIVAYSTKILMNEDNPQAFIVADCFRKPFFIDGGTDKASTKALFILACYEASDTLRNE